uniref:hypothetical protein n=1 Tax=Amycolatopsis sp. CA-096443 TaxID=3239919 RepID=UPI003F49898B
MSRVWVVRAVVCAGMLAILIAIAGPLSWWLTPAGTGQLPTLDRLAEEQNVRVILLWIFGAACVPVGWLLGSLACARPDPRRTGARS